MANETGSPQVPLRDPISSARFASQDVTAGLGPLAELAGSWRGEGFNLIARPDFRDSSDLYLQLNHTDDHIKFDPIGSPVPNRGFGQEDINLFGLTYLQKISDATLGSALHIEPGIWVTLPVPPLPVLTFPADVPPAGAQLVARMGSIPHGNSIVVEGIAEPFNGPPVLQTAAQQYNGSRFPSFNSTPFGVSPTAPAPVFNAATSSERLTAPTVGAVPFPQYDLSIPEGPIALNAHIPTPAGPIYNPPHTLNTRTPFGPPPPFPALANTPANQALVNDPIVFLQEKVQDQINKGYSFAGTVLNIATQATINFLTTPNSPPTSPKTQVNLPNFGGSPLLANGFPTVPNIQFLVGETVNMSPPAVPPNPPSPPAPQPAENAQTAMVYATFWIERVTHKTNGHSFMQLQYAQMVVLNFPIFHLFHQAPPVFVNLGWPHITVGTLKKVFG
jgi:hypothetical protein